MQRAASLARMGVRLTGALAIVLGLIVWTGKVDVLVPIHAAIGLLLVLALWVLTYVAWRSGVNGGLVALVAVWSAITPVLGLAQGGIGTGGSHWVVQVIHLLVGVAAIGLGEMLGGRIAGRSAAAGV